MENKYNPSITYGNNDFWFLKNTNALTDSSAPIWSNTPTVMVVHLQIQKIIQVMFLLL